MDGYLILLTCLLLINPISLTAEQNGNKSYSNIRSNESNPNLINTSKNDNQIYYEEELYYIKNNHVGEKISENLPIAVFHGISDNCLGWMEKWTNYIGQKSNSYTRCIESGSDNQSVFKSIREQSELACNIINTDEKFDNDFVIVAFSQGGLIARYVLEKCNKKGIVKKLITLGTPHMGVEKIPCNSEKNQYLCEIGTFFGQYLIYLPFLEKLYAPIAYFRTPSTEFLYRKLNKFLAVLNNESFSNEDNEINKISFKKLEKIVLIKFKKDELVSPKESAWFQKYDSNNQVEDLENSDFYKNDYLGLRYLNENKKIKFYEIDGLHMHFKKEDIDEYVIDELLN